MKKIYGVCLIIPSISAERSECGGKNDYRLSGDNFEIYQKCQLDMNKKQEIFSNPKKGKF